VLRCAVLRCPVLRGAALSRAALCRAALSRAALCAQTHAHLPAAQPDDLLHCSASYHKRTPHSPHLQCTPHFALATETDTAHATAAAALLQS
jgi:hypothetical protein